MTDSPKSALGELLIAAAQRGDTPEVHALLLRGASIEYKGGSWGATALGSACFFRREEAAEFLLSAGANPLATDRDGDTCLVLAQKLCSAGLVDKMQKIADPKEPSPAPPPTPPTPPPDCVARNIMLDGKALREVFDFAAMERRTYGTTSHGLVARESFSVIDDKKTLRAMLDELRCIGGDADDNIIYGHKMTVRVPTGKLL